MKKHNISKTDFVNGMICPLRIWLNKNKPEAWEAEETSQTEAGNEVGELARTYFPGAVTVPLDKAPVMAEETRRLMEEGHTTICEATFRADGLSCASDIVRIMPDGSLEVYEVKSSTSIKDVQLLDVTFQTHVIRRAGYRVSRVFLMHLNSDYVLRGDLDVRGLFRCEEVTGLVLREEGLMDADIRRVKAIAEQETEPEEELCLRCEKPYTCPCKGYCYTKHNIPERSVFDLAGMPAKKKYELYARGILTMEELLRRPDTMSAKQYTQVQVLADKSTQGDEIHVDKRMVKQFLDSIRFPLYQLDFETFQQAVPKFQGGKPYEQTPFQYSLHILDAPNGKLRHKEFLAEAGRDPRRGLAERLCGDIPIGAATMAYNMSFERTVCRHLAEQYPDLSDNLLSIAVNMSDLMTPFQKKWVSSKAMAGSYSIKVVLPALCGGDPELDYHALPVVHNGSEAMQTYAMLHTIPDRIEVERIRKGLLLYCGLDTLAMVKVLQKLYELCV